MKSFRQFLCMALSLHHSGLVIETNDWGARDEIWFATLPTIREGILESCSRRFSRFQLVRGNSALCDHHTPRLCDHLILHSRQRQLQSSIALRRMANHIVRWSVACGMTWINWESHHHSAIVHIPNTLVNKVYSLLRHDDNMIFISDCRAICWLDLALRYFSRRLDSDCWAHLKSLPAG